jgi:hypothetical protein
MIAFPPAVSRPRWVNPAHDYLLQDRLSSPVLSRLLKPVAFWKKPIKAKLQKFVPRSTLTGSTSTPLRDSAK